MKDTRSSQSLNRLSFRNNYELRNLHNLSNPLISDKDDLSPLNDESFINKNKYDNSLSTTNTINNKSNNYASHIKSKYLLIVSIIFMSITMLFVKLLFQSQSEIQNSHNSLNFFSGFYMFILSLIFIKVDNIKLDSKKNFNKSEFDYLIIRGLTGFFSMHFTIKAIKQMRFISAATLFYLAPVLSTLIQMLHKREKIKKIDKICFLSCILIILIFMIQDLIYHKYDLEYLNDSTMGIIYSVIAAILHSLNNSLDRKVSNEFHSYTIQFVIGTFSLILTPIFMSMSEDKFYMSPRIFVLNFIQGTSLFYGLYFCQKSIESNTLNINSSLHIITLFLAYVYTVVIFDEPFTTFDIISTIFVVIINFYMKLRAEELETNDNADNL